MRKLLETLMEGEDLDAKLDILTSIGATTVKEELFRACEDIRNDLCEAYEEGRKNVLPPIKRRSGSGIPTITNEDEGLLT